MEKVIFLYNKLKADTDGLDAVYEDYIICLIGKVGLELLMENRLLETCGIINGRQLYTLGEIKHEN